MLLAHNRSKARLLVMTQKVDHDDSNLGFFIEWIEKLAFAVDQVSVVCLEKGVYRSSLKNITISSLGKENLRSFPRGIRRVVYAYRFYQYIRRHVNDYDGVFIHMNPEYAVLGGRFWKKHGKKVLLWYVHKSVSPWLQLAERHVDKIFTASKESFRLPSPKVDIVGHGIDMNQFALGGMSPPTEPPRLLTVGRVSSSKDIETALRATAFLIHKRNIPARLDIIGDPITPEDDQYKKRIELLIRSLGIETQVSFLCGAPHHEMPRVYHTHDVLLHTSKTGSIDKTVLEALATGMPVFSSSEAFRSYSKNIVFTFPEGNPEALAASIEKIWISGTLVRSLVRREFVRQHHNLDMLVQHIASFFRCE